MRRGRHVYSPKPPSVCWWSELGGHVVANGPGPCGRVWWMWIAGGGSAAQARLEGDVSRPAQTRWVFRQESQGGLPAMVNPSDIAMRATVSDRRTWRRDLGMGRWVAARPGGCGGTQAASGNR